MECCICHKEFHGWGNDPAGAVWKNNGKIELLEFKNNDVCCSSCNSTYVVPGRLYRKKLNESMEKKDEI